MTFLSYRLRANNDVVCRLRNTRSKFYAIATTCTFRICIRAFYLLIACKQNIQNYRCGIIIQQGINQTTDFFHN